jgi:hypothetical protein
MISSDIFDILSCAIVTQPFFATVSRSFFRSVACYSDSVILAIVTQ